MKKQEEIEASEHFLEVYDQICENIADPEIQLRRDWKDGVIFKHLLYYPLTACIAVYWRTGYGWESKTFPTDESKECALFYAKIV